MTRYRYRYRTRPGLAAALLLSLYAGQTLAVAEGDTTTVTITGKLVDALECTVNGNNTVLVDFGDNIVARAIDGSNYHEDINVTLSCSSYVKNDMTLTILAAKDAGFGSGLVGTDKTGLGIQLYSGGTAMKAGDPISFVYPVIPKLSATLVAEDNTTLTSGTFKGTGTLVINYQ